MQQLVDYNDSLKEQLLNVSDEAFHKQSEIGEFVSEDVNRFTDLVFSPSSEEKCIKPVYTIDTVHSSNVICVVPWDQNEHFVFSSDVLKRIVCTQWYEDEKAIPLCEVSVSAPCCTLTTLYNGSLLLAGCMDGMVYIYAVEHENHKCTYLKVDELNSISNRKYQK